MVNCIKGFIAWLLIFVMIININDQTILAASEALNAETDYYDIKNHWAKEEINRLIDENVVSGIDEEGILVVKPNEMITRAEFVKLIITSLYSESEIRNLVTEVNYNNLLTDINTHWAKDYIVLANYLGIVGGYEDGTFRPNNPITRAEVVRIVATSHKDLITYQANQSSSFKDISNEHWAFEYIQTAKENEIVSGYTDNSFKPNKTITRAESMVITDRFINYDCNANFYQNLLSINVESNKTEVNVGDKVTFTIEGNNLDSNLDGVKRKEGLSYKILLINDDNTLEEILPGENNLELEITSQMSGNIIAKIVPYKNNEQLDDFTNGNQTLVSVLNNIEETIVDNGGITHNNSGHDTVKPDAPNAPKITSEIDNSEVKLTWEQIEGATEYTVKRGEKSGNYIILDTISNTTYTDTTRVPNTTYYYVVTANNEVGSSPNSNEIVYKTIPKESKLFGSLDGDLGNINWSIANGANYYTLYRSTVKGGPYYPIVENTLSNSYKDKNLTEGETYYYVVKAINELGESGFSNELAIGNDIEKEYKFNPSIDDDNDGISNEDELIYGTNPYDDDTDNDGILDGVEIQIGTDPLNPDTDGDGIYDGAEQVQGTDPLVKNSSSNSSKEAQSQDGNVKVVAYGDSNLAIAPLQVKEVDNVLLESLDGIVGKPVDITAGGFYIDKATIEFAYDDEDLNGIDENDLTIFYVNPRTMMLEPISDIAIDSDNNTVKGETSHFSMYLLGDKNMPVDLSRIDIVFTIDQSGSMYSNDPNFYRIKATERFVEEMDETKNRVGLVEFEGYGIIKSELTNDKEELLDILSTMKRDGGSTDIADGIRDSAGLFDEDSGRTKIIILLTDGQSNEEDALNEANIAASKNIIINTVALGSGADTELLEQIASNTKGGYFYINDEGNLSQEDVDKQIQLIYEKLAKQLAFTSIAEENDALPKSIVNLEFSDLYNGYDSKEVQDWLTTASSNLLTGNYIYDNTDIALDGPGFNISIDRTYNSFSKETGLFGTGFTSNIESKIEKNDSDRYGTVKAYSLNVRSSAGVKKNNKLGQISRGTEVEILNKNAGGTNSRPWYKIKYKNGEAYVAGWYISEKDALHVTYPSGSKIIFNYNDDKTMAVSSSSDDVVYIDTQSSYKYKLVKKDQSIYYYDTNGKVQAYTDRYNNKITFDYNGRNQIVKVTGAFSNRYLTIEYNSKGLVSQIKDSLGRVTKYTYDNNKNLITFTDMNGEKTKYTYNEDNRINKVINANGHQVVRNDYDLLGRLVRQYDGQNNIKYFIYDDNIDEENSISARYIIDENGNESKITFGPEMQPITVRDAKGGTTKYTYFYKNEDTGQWIDISTDVILRDGNNVEYTDEYKEYQDIVAQGNVEKREVAEVIRNIDTNGYENDITIKTITDRDKNGNIVKVQDPYGSTEEYVYDEYNNLISETDKKGNTKIYNYEDKVYLKSEIDPLGNTTTYEYYELDYSNGIVINGLLKSETDEAGNATLYEYNNGNNFLDGIIDAEGNEVKYTYDVAGRKLTETDANGNTIKYTYDNMNNITTIENPYGKTIKKSYDSVGNVIEETDFEGNTTKYEYDEENQVIKMTNPLGYIKTYTYDPYGNKIKEKYPNGAEVEYTYDALNRVSQVEDALGNIKTIEYDNVGNKIKETDELGRETFYIYDKLNRVIKEIAPENKVTSYTYDANDNITTLRDARGYKTSYTYDELNRQIKVEDALGYSEKTIYYDKENKIVNEDKLGRQTVTLLDGLDRTVEVVDPLNQSETTTYDGNGNIISKTDVAGNVTTYEYDKLNSLTKETITFDPIYTLDDSGVVVSDGSEVKKIIKYTYDNNGNKISQTDANGNTTKYTYNELNQLVEVTFADTSTYTYEYDNMGKVVKEVDQNGHEVKYNYDILSRKTEKIDAVGNKTKYDYDAVGNIIKKTDANGNSTTFNYDGLNRVVRKTDSKGNYEKMTYDALGNNTSRTDKNGNTTNYGYDPLNRLICTTDPYGNNTVTTYDAVGNKSTVTDALNNTVKFTYDDLNRKTTMKDPKGEIKYYAYDELGNQISVIDRNGNETRYVYDGLGTLKGVVDPEGTTTKYTYDLNGNTTSQTNGEGQTTRYIYDKLNRTIKMIDPSDGEETYTYDSVGNILSKTDRNGNTVKFTYYDNNLMKSETVGTINYRYTYDGVGNLLTATDPSGTTTYIYDEVNNLKRETLPNGKTIKYTYDANGNKLSLKDITGEVTTYTYDKMNRMKTVTTNDGTNTYTYDEIGNREKLELANGTYTTYQYNSNNHLIKLENYVAVEDEEFANLVNSTTSSSIYIMVDDSIDTSNSKLTEIELNDGIQTTTASALALEYDSSMSTTTSGAITINIDGHDYKEIDGKYYLRSTYNYTYDAEGYQTSKSEPKGNTTYEYDALERLIKVTEPNGRETTYTYDSAGNRATQTVIGNDVNSDITYTYDARNKLIQTVEVRNGKTTTTDYTYDANGNQVKVEEKTDGKTNTSTYEYDELNQLIKAKTADGKVIENTYNFKGMRNSKTIDSITTDFYYDGKTLIAEVTDNGVVRNINGVNLIARQGQNTLYYLYNGHADVVEIVNSDGIITNQYDYDVFGNIILSSEGYRNTSKYSGYYYDEETGYYYLQSRYYDPEIARFITEDTYKGKYSDPLSLNLYTYCANNPVSYWDPTGHWRIIISEYENEKYIRIQYDDKVLGGSASIINSLPFGSALDYYGAIDGTSKWLMSKLDGKGGLTKCYVYEPDEEVFDKFKNWDTSLGFANDSLNTYTKVSGKFMSSAAKNLVKNAGSVISIGLGLYDANKRFDNAEKDAYLKAMIQASGLDEELEAINNPDELFLLMTYIEGKLESYGEDNYKKFDKYFNGSLGYGLNDYTSDCGITLWDKITGNVENKKEGRELVRDELQEIAKQLKEDYISDTTPPPKDILIERNETERNAIFYSPSTESLYRTQDIMEEGNYEVKFDTIMGPGSSPIIESFFKD